jgi:hypothetical protein
LYLTHKGLIQAQESVGKHPDRRFWIEGIGVVRYGRTELDKALGEGGENSSEIVRGSVVARWPAIRDHLMKIEAAAKGLAEFGVIPACSERSPTGRVMGFAFL